jgi:hypothetical protein
VQRPEAARLLVDVDARRIVDLGVVEPVMDDELRHQQFGGEPQRGAACA